MIGDPCTYCGGAADTWDHIVPRDGGGLDEPSNMTRACRRCNSSKGTDSLLIFLLCRAPTTAADRFRALCLDSREVGHVRLLGPALP